MKAYSIGREVGCDIVINDNTDVISRRHAILNVYPTGKMTIIDQSHNGTYVNGIRINANTPFPVTRKDNVSFAHIARLDWDQVPDPTATMRYVIMAIIGLLVIAGCFFGYRSCSGNEKPITTDTIPTLKLTPEQLKQREKEIQDSVQKQVKDSLDQARKEKQKKDSLDKVNNRNRQAKDSADARKRKEAQEKARKDSIEAAKKGRRIR